MSRSRRVIGLLLMSGLLVAAMAPAVQAAGPTTETINLNDPAIDADETAWASDWCGFPVDADVSGRIAFKVFPSDRRGVVELDIYGIRVTYVNPATGAWVKLRDIGPDRFFVKHGQAYVAITGRSANGSGVYGVVIIDLQTGEVVHNAGKDAGIFNDWFCDAIAG